VIFFKWHCHSPLLLTIIPSSATLQGRFTENKEVPVTIAIIIPARFASTRLPGKPLLRETGKYLIQHVCERACQSRAGSVIVATDDKRIERAVREFGGAVAMTRPDHES